MRGNFPLTLAVVKDNRNDDSQWLFRFTVLLPHRRDGSQKLNMDTVILKRFVLEKEVKVNCVIFGFRPALRHEIGERLFVFAGNVRAGIDFELAQINNFRAGLSAA